VRPWHLLHQAAHGECAGADEGREMAAAPFAQEREHEKRTQKAIDRQIFVVKAR